jgi:hypothetical protein
MERTWEGCNGSGNGRVKRADTKQTVWFSWVSWVSWLASVQNANLGGRDQSVHYVSEQ